MPVPQSAYQFILRHIRDWSSTFASSAEGLMHQSKRCTRPPVQSPILRISHVSNHCIGALMFVMLLKPETHFFVNYPNRLYSGCWAHIFLFYSIKRGVILTFYTFCSNKKPEAKPRAFYSQNVWKVKITPLFMVKCRLQGTFYSRKVVKSVFEPTFYRNLLRVKSG